MTPLYFTGLRRYTFLLSYRRTNEWQKAEFTQVGVRSQMACPQTNRLGCRHGRLVGILPEMGFLVLAQRRSIRHRDVASLQCRCESNSRCAMLEALRILRTYTRAASLDVADRHESSSKSAAAARHETGGYILGTCRMCAGAGRGPT